MKLIMNPRERTLYLLQAQAQVQLRLSMVLANITVNDVAAMSLIERERLSAVLSRVPVGIAPATCTYLRDALAATEVAA